MMELFLIHKTSPFTIPGSYGSAQDEIIMPVVAIFSADVNLQVSNPRIEEALKRSSVKLQTKEIKKIYLA